jgi:hypothetical protein
MMSLDHAAPALIWRGSVPARLTTSADVLALIQSVSAFEVPALAAYALAFAALQNVDLATYAAQIEQTHPGNLALRRVTAQAMPNVAALLRMASDEARRIDRAAERCGRIATDLLADRDLVWINGDGLPIAWMLHTAKQRGVVVQHWDATSSDMPGFSMAVAAQIACDGTAQVTPLVAPQLRFCTDQGIPCYLLAPHGPEPELSDGNVFPPDQRIGADQINVIVTARGVYRPAMVQRHLRDSDAPLDVIPLA